MTTDHTSGMLPPESDASGATPALIGGFESTSAPLLVMPAERDGSGDGYSSQSVVHSGATTAIEFRVTRPESPVRRLRLSGPRYTFGSGEGCSIRLSDDDLLPLHAVLIREPERIGVRAYSVPIEINGDRVSEGTLRLGDVLTLGSYRFELLSTSASAPIRGAAFQVPAFGAGETGPLGRLSFLDSTLVTAESTSRSDASGSGAVGRNDRRRTGAGKNPEGGDERWWRERLRREVDLWRARQADCDRRHAECDRRDARCDGRESELRQRESELWARLEELRQRESELTTAAFRSELAERTLTEAHDRLEKIRRKNNDLTQEFERREEELKRTAAECRQRAETAERELAAARGQADTASETVEAMRAQFVTLRQQLTDLTEQHAALESREQTRREEYESDFETIRNELERARQDARTERQRAAECEELAEQLDAQVVELQKAVAEAREESERLRHECEAATRSIAELEPLAEMGRQTDERQAAHEAEVQRLSESVDRLADDLAEANNELSLLRESNQDLVKRLEQTRVELDAAIADADARPTYDEVRSLREELESAQEELSVLRRAGDRDPGPRSGTEADTYGHPGRSTEGAGAVWPGSTDREFEIPEPSSAGDGIRAGEQPGENSSCDWQSPSWFRTDDDVPFEAPADGETSQHTVNWETTREEIQDPASESFGAVDCRQPDGAPTTNWQGIEDVAGGALDEDDGERIDEPGEVSRQVVSESVSDGPEVDGPEIESDAQATLRSEPAEPPGSMEPAASAPEPEPADDSIEAYMNRLLQRVHGPSSQTGSVQPGSFQAGPAIGAAGSSLTETGASAISSTKPSLESESLSRSTMTESHGFRGESTGGAAANEMRTTEEDGGGCVREPQMVPRSHPPEKDNKIEALRDLANESAHSAISRSARVQTRDSQLRGLAKLGAASIAALSGVAAWWWIHGPVRFLGVTASTIVTAFFLYEAVSLIRDARRRVALLEAGRLDLLINSHTKTGHPSHNPDRKPLADPPGVTDDASVKLDSVSKGDAEVEEGFRVDGDSNIDGDAALEGKDRGGLDTGRDPA